MHGTVQLLLKSKGEAFSVFFDEEDRDLVESSVWCILHAPGSCRKYAFAGASRKGGGRTVVLMHRLITGAPPGMDVDHINGNGLDNRRCNLRVCTRSENNRNSVGRQGTSTGVRGVREVVQASGRVRYKAQISSAGKVTYLGYFDSIAEARRAWDLAASQIDPTSYSLRARRLLE